MKQWCPLPWPLRLEDSGEGRVSAHPLLAGTPRNAPDLSPDPSPYRRGVKEAAVLGSATQKSRVYPRAVRWVLTLVIRVPKIHAALQCLA